MEKRLLIALVLSIAFLFLYQQAVVRWITPPQEKKTVAENAEPEKIEQKKEEMAVAPAIKKKTAPLHAESKEALVSVETPFYTALFSTKGGGIKSWRLKNYRESMENASPQVEIVAPGLDTYTLEDTLTAAGAEKTIAYRPSKTSVSLSKGQKDELIFSGTSADGIRIEKRYSISADTYAVKAETVVSNASSRPYAGSFATRLSASLPLLEKRSSTYHKGLIVYKDGKADAKDIKEGEETLSGKIGWIGLEEMYFMTAMIPQKGEGVQYSSQTTKDSIKAIAALPLNLAPNAESALSYTLYIGPKEMDILHAQGVHMEDAINLGWFSFLAKPLLSVMNFFNSYIHNYGLTIILLTVIIKILFHPLTKKGLDSMKEMQRIQPQMSALKEKYKNDREKMNRETMELYKRYKINPLGGCMPMVLQIPVFIALYNALSASIELRHAPFALWIHDLSAKDPYYITPVLMGATMLLQQKMTPTGMDPMQAKMMLIMPVIFTFMFLSFPSGLVLYWLVNNVLSIAQQYYIQKKTK